MTATGPPGPEPPPASTSEGPLSTSRPPAGRALKRWAVSLCRFDPSLDQRWLVALVADRVAEALDAPPVSGEPGRSPLPAGEAWPAPPDGWADPWLLGAVHEQSAPAADRKARGAWYTPRSVVEGLVRLATPDDRRPVKLVDPTCGGGAFLLAGLDRLVALGIEPEEAVARIGGIDLDPVAVDVARWSVRLWLAAHLRASGGEIETAGRIAVDVRQGDALAGWPGSWPRPLVVAGNPPFASPLKRGVVPASAAQRRAERSDLLGPYADIAAVHLLDAVERAGPGSTVTLIQPQSMLASRDTEPLRAHLADRAPLTALWVARESVFDAGVRACAPVLAVGAERGASAQVALASGPDVQPVGDRSPQPWSHHAADALGAPSVPPLSGRLGELVTATAGFRDEHYGLVSVCREAEPGEATGGGTGSARLATVGSVDPLDRAGVGDRCGSVGATGIGRS